MQEIVSSGILPARVGVKGSDSSSGKMARLLFRLDNPLEIIVGYSGERRFDLSDEEFRDVMVIGREQLNTLLTKGEDLPNARLHWGFVAFKIPTIGSDLELELRVETWLIEVFLDTTYRAVPREQECEFFAGTNELDEEESEHASAVTSDDWARFEGMLTMSADLQRSGDWDAALRELGGQSKPE